MFKKYYFSILAMYFNNAMSSAAHRLLRCCGRSPKYTELAEHTPLLGNNSEKPNSDLKQNGHSSVLDTELTLKDCEDLGKNIIFLLRIWRMWFTFATPNCLIF